VVPFALWLVLLSASPAQAAWTETEISNFGEADSETSSLVIAPGGGVFVAWFSGGDDLFWARRTANGWRKTQVTGQDTFIQCHDSDYDGIGPSAAFAPDGTARIATACIAVGDGAPVYFSEEGPGGWTTEFVGHGPFPGNCNASATDIDLINNPVSGRPVVIITDRCTHSVAGFFFRRGEWERRTLVRGTTGPFLFGALAVAVDPTNGKFAMVFNRDVRGRAEMLFREYTWKGDKVPGTAHRFSLPDGEVAWDEPALAFLPDGTGYVAFRQGTPYGTPADAEYGFLALSIRAAGVWSAPVVVDDSVQVTGAEPSLSLVGGSLHVAYHDVANGDLRYATSADGSTWDSETIVGPDVTGMFPSLGVRSTGTAIIAYHDRTDTALMSTRGP
jgi:hypothetical protein